MPNQKNEKRQMLASHKCEAVKFCLISHLYAINLKQSVSFKAEVFYVDDFKSGLTKKSNKFKAPHY